MLAPLVRTRGVLCWAVRGALSLLGGDLVSELTPRDVTTLIGALFPSPVSQVTGQS